MAKPKSDKDVEDAWNSGEDVSEAWESGEDVPDEPAAFAGAAAQSTGEATRGDPRRRPGAGESFVQGVANAFGTGDTIGAMLQAAMQEGSDIPEWLSGAMTLDELQRRRNQTFSDARAENLRLTRAGMEDNPAASIAGRLIPGVMMGPAMGAGTAFGSSAAMGGASGALEGAAQSDAETPGQLAADVGTGAGFGALGGGAGYLAGRYLLAPAGAHIGRQAGRALSRNADSLQEGAERFAQERALKATGYIQKDLPKERAAYERLLRSGQTLLDEPGLIRPGSSAAGINERLEPLVEREGQRIGQYLDAADASWGAAPYNPNALAAEIERARAAGLWRGGPFNPEQFINDAAENVALPYTRNPSLRGEGEGVSRWLNNLRETTDAQAAEGVPFTFRQANEYKGDLQNAVFNAQGLPKANKAAQNELQRELINAIDQQAEPLIGAQNVAGFRDARQRYGTFTNAFEKSQQQVNREVGNNFMGLKDMQSGQMAQAGIEGVPYVGPLAAFASKLARGRMDATAARAADALAKSSTLQTLANTSPEVVGAYGGAVGGVAGQVLGDIMSSSPPGEDWMDRVARENPEALGKWGEYLGSAASQSPESLSMAKYDLGQTDPDYQQQRRKQGDTQR